jgi:hypothetical protein
MPVRDHQGIEISTFNGLWQRGDIDNTPIDHFSDCNNIDFVGNAFGTRPGIGISQTVNVPLDNIIRIYNYATQTANTLIVLAIDASNNGNIYHVVSPSLVYGPILTIAGMTDFAFVPYAGRGYISPIALSQPALNPPSALLAQVVSGTGLSAGVYQYASTFVNPLGETTVSAITTVTTLAALANPVVTAIISDLGISGGNVLVPGATYKWLFTYQRQGLETNIGSASIGFVSPAATHGIGLQPSSAFPIFTDTTTLVNVYRTVANGATYYLESQIPFSTIPLITGSTSWIIGIVSDAQLITAQQAPAANATAMEKVNLTSIPTDPTGSATSRNIYRTKVNLAALLLDHTLADNTTIAYADTNADATLTTAAPTANTAFTGTNLIAKGMSGQSVYVYAGDGTAARKAAGAGLIGTMTVANGIGGHTDPGQHIFGIVSQTISGYNAPPSILTPFITNGTSVSFGSIPTSGSAAVTKRLLVSTIAIPAAEYVLDSNPLDYEFFFVPGAVINNNTDTFLNNISFYDADLLADASALLNNYTSIPAGAVLNLYHNRLVVAATFTDISLALLSQVGQPEAISQISGLIIAPLDGNPITNAQEYRDTFYLFKRARTLSYVDNGQEPSFWPLIVIDNALGTSIHGIATVLDSGSSSVDFLLIATYQGISQFNGKYVTPELSWKISDFWKKLDRTKFNSIQIVNESISKKIYCVLPTKNLLVGDYVNGIDWKNVKWAPWSFYPKINTIAIQNISDVILGAAL